MLCSFILINAFGFIQTRQRVKQLGRTRENHKNFLLREMNLPPRILVYFVFKITLYWFISHNSIFKSKHDSDCPKGKQACSKFGNVCVRSFYRRSEPTVSHHPLQLGVPAVLQHKEPAAEGALQAEALQMRRKQCCQVFLSAPLLQLLEPLHKKKHIHKKTKT